MIARELTFLCGFWFIHRCTPSLSLAVGRRHDKGPTPKPGGPTASSSVLLLANAAVGGWAGLWSVMDMSSSGRARRRSHRRPSAVPSRGPPDGAEGVLAT